MMLLQAQNNNNSSASFPSLAALSAGWLALCTGLVLKHGELLTVFVAFCACFALAAIIMMLSGTSSTTAEAVQVRNTVSVTMYSAALAYLAITTTRDDNTTKAKLFLTSLPCPEFVALSTAAGTLAFDHWYSHLFCCPPPLHWFRVAQQALLLTAAVVVLVVAHPAALSRHRTVICAALVYQIVRATAATPVVATTTTTTLTQKKSTVSHNKASSAASTTQKNHSNDNQNTTITDRSQLWHLNGQSYDLRSFLERHPGGREALLLGQGRHDCTALVQSYHPFNLTAVQQALQKYRLVDNLTKNTQNDNNTLMNDPFYDVLRQRVYQTLQQQGFDPLQDRAANVPRICYYMLIVTGVLLSAWGHVKVCMQ